MLPTTKIQKILFCKYRNLSDEETSRWCGVPIELVCDVLSGKSKLKTPNYKERMCHSCLKKYKFASRWTKYCPQCRATHSVLELQDKMWMNKINKKL